MVTYSFNVGAIDRGALAEELISSAVRVLTIGGFSAAEVADLFKQASEQLAGDRISTTSDEDGGDQDEAVAIVDVYDLIERFDALPATQNLSRLGKRSRVIDELDDPATLTNATQLLTEALVLRREVLDWVRAEAASAGLEVANSRDEWIKTASDDDLDREESFLFLDDYRFSADFNWYVISQVARTLSESGDKSALDVLSPIVLDEDLALDERIREDVQRASEAVEHFQAFRDHVLHFSGHGELMQAEILDNYVRANGFNGGTYVVEEWLENMMKQGLLERYKRSNRWRINVF